MLIAVGVWIVCAALTFPLWLVLLLSAGIGLGAGLVIGELAIWGWLER